MKATQSSLGVLRAIMVATLVLPLLLFAVASWTAYLAEHRSADARIVQTLDILQEHALKVFESGNLAISYVSQLAQGVPDQEIRQREEIFHRQFQEISKTINEIGSIWIFDARGTALAASNVFPLPPTSDYTDREYFRAHVEKEIGTHFGEIVPPRIATTPPTPVFFSMSRRRPSEDGSFKGVIQVSVVPNTWEQFYARLGREGGHYFAMLLPNGAYLASYPFAASPTTRLDERSGFRDIIARNPAGGLHDSVLADGIERRVGTRKLPGYSVYVSAGLEKRFIRSAWLSTVFSHLYYGVPITAALLMTLGYAYRRTEKLHEEEHRREVAETNLRQAQNLEAVGQLTGGVAHDFNNLLTIILGNLEALLRRNGVVPGHERFVNNAMVGARSAAELTKRLLAFARRQPLDPKPSDLNTIIGGMSELLRRSLGETIEVEFAGGAGLWTVETDVVELEAMLLNLAVNARDAMPQGGKLTIETSNVFLDEHYCRSHEDLTPGQYVLIAVSDTGTGMSKDVLEKAFEPFFTTKDVSKGSGLGLSQVYGFVKQSRGHVSLYSEPMEGTTVKVYLPRYYGAHGASAKPDGNTALVPGKGETILVVEDNTQVRRYIVETLLDCQYHVIEAASGAIALELLSSEQQIDLLLTDVVLPGMNGRVLADQVKILQPSVKVLFMTGYSRNAIVHQGRLDPGVNLLQKPISETVLVSRVRELIDSEA